MTVAATNVSSGPYTGNGATTVFPFTFSASGASEVQVLVNGVVATVPFIIALNSNQSTTPGGSVTFTTAPANGVTVLITSNPSFQQLISFKDSGPFLQSTLDTALDRIARLLLYLKDKLGRAVVFPIGETVSTLPSATARAGKFMGFDGSGNIVALPGTSGDPGLRADLAATTGHALIGGLTEPITPKQQGALGDGINNDSIAEAAAVTAVGSGGGAVYHTTGNYLNATALNLDSKYNLTLRGDSGGAAGSGHLPPGRITFSGTGTTGGISAAHADAVLIRDMGVRYSAAFTGDLIAFTNLTSGADASYCGLDRVLAGGSGANNGARSVVSFEGAIICAVTNSHLQKAQVGIRFCKQVGVGNVLYSNANMSFNNTFDNLTTAGLTNFGQGCLSLADRAEGTNDGTSGGMPAFYLDTLDAGASPAGGNGFLVPWCGDDVALTTAWWCNGLREHRGLLFAGGFYGTANTMKPCLKFTTSVSGCAVVGTHMAPVSIDFASADHYGMLIAGNYFGADVTNITSASDDIAIIANKKEGGFAKNYLRLNTVQEWRVGARATNITGGPGIFIWQAPTTTALDFWLSGDAGTNRLIDFASDGTPRAKIGLDTSNNFGILTYSAIGAFVGYALTVNPATMAATFGGAVTAPSLAVTGALTSSGGGVGYATGAGGAVTQATSRTTGVTLNKLSGQITLFSAAGSATWATFTVTNSQVAATDVIRLNQASGTDKYMLHITHVAAGTFDVTFATTGGTTTEQPVFNFAVIKAVAA